MGELEVEKVLQDAICNASIGQKIVLNFLGNPEVIDVEMAFKGGWVVTQTIIPGKPFEFTKGEDGYLLSINVTINPYSGIQHV